MSYISTNWKTGDIVTSEKLNHMEDGIANSESVMIITVVTEDPAQSAKNLLRAKINDKFLDKTWQQIFDALNTGKVCVIKNGDETYVEIDFVTTAGERDGSYIVMSNKDVTYEASSADGYPKRV